MSAPPQVCILYEFREGPWGGGNQFLKALRNGLAERGVGTADPAGADIVLVNSHHRLADAVRLKRRRPETTVIHRVDGPVGLIRGNSHEVDAVLYRFNQAVAAGTVFQSEWSRAANEREGLAPSAESTVIVNAPDPAIFDREGKAARGERLRLIATSWSPNPRKGFDLYEFLDRSLDFRRYEMTFVGNSPIRFSNIRQLDPLPSAELAAELRRHDVFVTGSRADPCSNSLLEALHCGLPALALHDGGHPELIGQGGETFHHFEEALAKLDRIAGAYPDYQARIALPSLDEVVDGYVEFIQGVHARARAGRPPSVLSVLALSRALESRLGSKALRAASAVSGRRFP